MKWLTVVVLIVGTFAPTVFARCGATQAMKDRRKVLAGWIGIVRVAENKYKSSTHGRYGDLTDLRKAHLLDTLVFESDSSGSRHGEFVPKSTLFQVTVSSDGQHFKAMIQEKTDKGSFGENADETGRGSFMSCPPPQLPVQDGPEGPIIALPR